MASHCCRLPRLLALLLPVLALVAVAFVLHWRLASSSILGAAQDTSTSPDKLEDGSNLVVGLVRSNEEETERARRVLGLAEGLDALQPAEVRDRVQELLRIKQSILRELRELEQKSSELQKQSDGLQRRIEELQTEAAAGRAAVERERASAELARLAREEYARRNTPEIRAPLPLQDVLRPMQPIHAATSSEEAQCSMETCFDISRCPLTSTSPVFVQDLDRHKDLFPNREILTNNQVQACFTLVFADRIQDPFGRNSLVVFSSARSHDSSFSPGRAMVAAADFEASKFRPGFDLIVPPMSESESKAVSPIQETPYLLPVRRKFLVSFQGSKSPLSALDESLLLALRGIKTDVTDDDAFVDTNCQVDMKVNARTGEWGMCGDADSRAKVLSASIFSLIPSPSQQTNHLSTSTFQLRVLEALRSASIPVVVGAKRGQESLPFSEVIDWKRAAVFVPSARLTELHFLLRTLTDDDLFAMRLQGSRIYKHYLSSKSSIVRTALHVVRERLGLPPPVMHPSPSPDAFEGQLPTFAERGFDLEPQESLVGPLEPPRPSVPFRRNFTSVAVDGYARWNERFFDAFWLAPDTPWDPELPTDAKFRGSPEGFRPVGEGAGGSGAEFSRAVGGNARAEQFTAVLLTYEREQVLMESVARLYGLPFLNKVIVVWNSDVPPSPDLQWPDLGGVPLKVIRPGRNSLNNRFLPFDEIETEAVLSLDDDMSLRHQEIVFAFRVWRENRDVLVGFPGRFHAWDVNNGDGWNYNSNHSCELSMVLTGAAFFHRYYAYAYTHAMPQAIRDKVDEYMNCEDIAMNFLVSSLSGKPPVKVTSRWTFNCPGCPSSLWDSPEHFEERHKCINYFAQVLGHTPLKYTQFRADSVLFKTRIPADKQKCYKLV